MYDQYQKTYDELKEADENVVFTNDLDDVDKLIENVDAAIVVYDDRVLDLISNNTDILSFILQKGHHKNLVLILLTQAIFLPKCRLIQINVHYLITFKLLRDSSSILRLGYQILPRNSRFLYDAYE